MKSEHRTEGSRRSTPWGQAILLSLILVSGLAQAAEAPVVYLVELADAIQPISAAFVIESLKIAEEEKGALLILELDTPGGLVSSTEEMVKAITDSPVPVVVFVSGTQAASAGFYITIAADVAVMAPGTRFGAAHPVGVIPGGESEEGGDSNIMMEKVENDAAAWIRTLAENRGRNVELAEAAVRESRSFTEKEALENDLIDYVQDDVPAILEVLDGVTIRRFNGEEVTLALAGATVRPLSMTPRERFLSWLASPNILFILLMAAALGLYVEFTQPGLIFPGVIGAIALLLFAYSTQLIPINYAGLLLILLAITLFILEIKVTSYGMLTVGGIVCLVLGGLMLFRTPDVQGLQVPLYTVISLSLAAGLIMAFLTQRVLWAHRMPVVTGEEGLMGEIGEALTPIDQEGKVFVHGEHWNAVSRSPVKKGSRIRVVGIDGMTLEVEEKRESTRSPVGEEGEA